MVEGWHASFGPEGRGRERRKQTAGSRERPRVQEAGFRVQVLPQAERSLRLR